MCQINSDRPSMNPQMFLLRRLFSLVGWLVSNSHVISNALVVKNGAAVYYQQVLLGEVCLWKQVLPSVASRQK